MAEFIPTATEENVGVNEVLLHAQKIIEAFSKALSDNNCMTQIPIAVYSEAQNGVDQMEDALIAMGDPNNENIRRLQVRDTLPPNQASGVQLPKDEEFILNGITNNLRRIAGEECIDCGWDEFPDFSVGDLWENVMQDLEDWINKFEQFLDQFRGLDKALDPSICHLTYLLSFVCIPDLIRLLALLLALLIKLLSGININGFSLLGFINAIIGAIIGALLDYIASVLDWALSPIGCIIDSLSLVIDQFQDANNDKLTASFQLLKDKSSIYVL
jgi:hypothetical protein